jgi:gamma-glutamyltranspeptidase/glutathione hydrolase
MRNFQSPGRSVVMARNGMAATSHSSATLAAIQVLESGGNAMDAAIAACAVQCVVEPGSTGIGGDCFVLYSERGSDDVVAYNGAGWAPRAATLGALRDRSVTSLARNSPHSVTVPGSIEAWTTLRDRFGSLPLDRLLAPAIRFAEEGYVVSPRSGADWVQQADYLGRSPHARQLMLQDGRAPQVGSIHRQPRLAQTLRTIGTRGRRAFYEGPIAEEMVAYLSGLGGLHTLDDFASYRGEFVTPISSTFRGHRIVECPPPGQGVIALLILNMLERHAAQGDPLSADRLQLEIDATRAAYAVRDAVLGDPRAAAVDVEALLSKDFASKLLATPAPSMPAPGGAPHKDTVYLCVVDKDRNCASFINSLFHPFGSGLMTPESGILLHNRGQSFVMEEGHANCIAPRKRPLHTIIPGMVTKDGRVEMVFGVMGGSYQAMGHAHFLSKVLDYGLNIQAASDLPRVFPIPGARAIEAETTLPPEVRAELERRGYEFVPPSYAALGGAQAIRIDWQQGCLHGASDHRKDGCALGY